MYVKDRSSYTQYLYWVACSEGLRDISRKIKVAVKPSNLNGRIVQSSNRRLRFPYFPTYPLRHNRQLSASASNHIVRVSQTSATPLMVRAWTFVRILYGAANFRKY